MIDWYVVQYLYPKSYEMFVNTMFPNTGVISTSLLNFLDVKKLYKFFDDNGIYLTIERYGKNQWSYVISFKNGIVLVPDQINRETREEIEIDGFIECFKHLDQMLMKKVF